MNDSSPHGAFLANLSRKPSETSCSLRIQSDTAKQFETRFDVTSGRVVRARHLPQTRSKEVSSNWTSGLLIYASKPVFGDTERTNANPTSSWSQLVRLSRSSAHSSLRIKVRGRGARACWMTMSIGGKHSKLNSQRVRGRDTNCLLSFPLFRWFTIVKLPSWERERERENGIEEKNLRIASHRWFCMQLRVTVLLKACHLPRLINY